MHDPINTYLDELDTETAVSDAWDFFNEAMAGVAPLGLTLRQILDRNEGNGRFSYSLQLRWQPHEEYVKYWSVGRDNHLPTLLNDVANVIKQIQSEDDLMKLFKTDLFTSITGEMIPEGQDIVLTIAGARLEEIRGGEEKPALTFEENKKVLILNKTNVRVLHKLFGTDDTDLMKGKKIALYATEVSAFGKTTRAVRIRDRLPQAS